MNYYIKNCSRMKLTWSIIEAWKKDGNVTRWVMIAHWNPVNTKNTPMNSITKQTRKCNKLLKELVA
jgi:hypothetical protein